MYAEFLPGNQTISVCVCVCVCGRRTLKQVRNKCNRECGVDSVGQECGLVAGCCENCNETGFPERSRFSYEC
jgi:hypothetical protein